jgi:hypothetical protein
MQARRPRHLGDRTFSAGITAWSSTRIRYTLPAGAGFLLGWVGVDPLRGKGGVCDVAVSSGGRTLAEFNSLTLADGARLIAVPLTGPDLQLITDFGPAGELNDCVQWCDLLLISKSDAGPAPGL